MDHIFGEYYSVFLIFKNETKYETKHRNLSTLASVRDEAYQEVAELECVEGAPARATLKHQIVFS